MERCQCLAPATFPLSDGQWDFCENGVIEEKNPPPEEEDKVGGLIDLLRMALSLFQGASRIDCPKHLQAFGGFAAVRPLDRRICR